MSDPELLASFLEDSYKPLEQLLQEIVESGWLDTLLRSRIEDELYVMAGQGKADYHPDHGWKLADNVELTR